MGVYSRKLKTGFSSTDGSGDAPVITANATSIGVPEVTQDRWVKVSFSSAHGKVFLRVTQQTPSGAHFVTRLIDPVVPRTDPSQSVQLMQGCTKVTVNRMHYPECAEDTPADALIEYNGV